MSAHSLRKTAPPPNPFADVAQGTSSDAFSILGPHRQGDDLCIRVVQPSARLVEVHIGSEWHAMRERTERGLFELLRPLAREAEIPAYHLRVTFGDGRVVDLDDPYRYGPVFSGYDLHLFGEGTLTRAFECFGAHRVRVGSTTGVHFAVWAPNAQRVSLVGPFNGWDGRVHPMRHLLPSGVWELFVPDLLDGALYKFEIRTQEGHLLTKSDPFGVFFELPPATASIVRDISGRDGSGYEWADAAWVDARAGHGEWIEEPMAVYEVHLGSWARVPEEAHRPMTYRELADRLPAYVKDLGFTHIELLPVMEHPFAPSWGYQVLGFFAPTSRFGPPEDFKYFVDRCHQAGLGVILDWVPGHFPRDAHGLARFDGTALYEHEDPRQGEHQDWGTLIFNYGRNEVQSFLLSSARFWLEEYHIDGLRVDAVASMLYLDYSRRDGEWIPNRYGGRENLEAIEFLQRLNILTHGEYPGTVMAAEESTAWPGVSRPVHLGGLGFTYKWNMGWMHDMLRYLREDPVHRRWHHDLVTFSMLYAFSENFVLPLSHDEVVHGKAALLDKMPGDLWQRYATLRTFLGYMWGHPGKKLLFMGGEFGQWREWHHDHSLDWHLLDDEPHAAIRRFVQALNWHYRAEPALHERDFTSDGFRWIDCHDNENSVVSFVRYAKDPRNAVIMVFNFTPVPRYDYLIGVPAAGYYTELLNSDAATYGGSNLGNAGGLTTQPNAMHGFEHSLALTVPPLGCLLLKKQD